MKRARTQQAPKDAKAKLTSTFSEDYRYPVLGQGIIRASLVFTGSAGIIMAYYSVTPLGGWYLPGSKQPSIKLAYVGYRRLRGKHDRKRLCAQHYNFVPKINDALVGAATGAKGLPLGGLSVMNVTPRHASVMLRIGNLRGTHD